MKKKEKEREKKKQVKLLLVRINRLQNPKSLTKFSNSLVILALRVHRFLKAKMLYSQLSRSLEMHVQGTLKINN